MEILHRSMRRSRWKCFWNSFRHLIAKPRLSYITWPTKPTNVHAHLCTYIYVMAHAQKQDFVFRRNGRVHLNLQGRQFSRLLAAEVCASAVVMLDTRCSEVVWRVLATDSIRQFPLHFTSRASPCAITFQLDSTSYTNVWCTVCPQKVLSSPSQHMSLSWARRIHSTIAHSFHLRSTLIIFSHPHLRLSSRLLPSDVPIKDPYVRLVSPKCATCPSNFTGYDFVTLKFLENSANHVCSVHSNAHKVIAGFFLSPEPEVT
jgi:hypothetical protein